MQRELPLLPNAFEHLLADNVAFHKSKASLAAARAVGLMPLFTPPYTPQWNPTEMAFSLVKRRLQAMSITAPAACRSGAEVERRVRDCVEALDPSVLRRQASHVWADVAKGP